MTTPVPSKAPKKSPKKSANPVTLEYINQHGFRIHCFNAACGDVHIAGSVHLGVAQFLQGKIRISSECPKCQRTISTFLEKSVWLQLNDPNVGKRLFRNYEKANEEIAMLLKLGSDVLVDCYALNKYVEGKPQTGDMSPQAFREKHKELPALNDLVVLFSKKPKKPKQAKVVNAVIAEAPSN